MENKWNCPIVICAFNRPDYLRRCMEYLFKTPDIAEYNIPIYIFCDGGIDATQEENTNIISQYPLVTKTFYQTENLCIAKHIFFLRETIFDVMNYPRMMFLEDDIIVSPFYYRFMNWALDAYQQVIDPTVGMINSRVRCLDTLDQKLNKQHAFSDLLSHLNNYIVLRNTWTIIKPTMLEYMEKFVVPASSYRNMDHDAVIAWAKEKLTNSKSLQSRNEKTWLWLTSS